MAVGYITESKIMGKVEEVRLIKQRLSFRRSAPGDWQQSFHSGGWGEFAQVRRERDYAREFSIAGEEEEEERASKSVVCMGREASKRGERRR